MSATCRVCGKPLSDPPEPERKFERAPAWRHFATFGSIGARTFSDQSAAEHYLKALPAKYSGRCYKSETGKWTVAYHRFDVPDPTSKDKRGN